VSAIESFEQLFGRIFDRASVSAEDDKRLYALAERSGLPKMVVRSLYFIWLELGKEIIP
jgi:hypothetical protein